jgi:DNA/RNA-binding domain of Phe-tRNA-synthetase-like protein
MDLGELVGIDAAVARAFPEIMVAVAVVHDVRVAATTPGLATLRDEVLATARRELADRPLAELPRVQGFRRIYRRFGVDPTTRRPSAEALLRRALRPDRGWPAINTVVDAYNLASVRFQLPAAAYDLDRVAPPVTLRFARAGEVHRGIGQEEPEPVPEGTLIYDDRRIVLCREYNYRDADETKVTLATRNLLVFVDGCAAVSRADLEAALATTTDWIVAFNGGHVAAAGLIPASAADEAV